MKFSEMTTEQLPIEKFPHLKFQEEQLVVYQTLIERLNKRKEYIAGFKDKLDGYEANEKEIELIKTDIELARSHTGVVKKKTYIKDFKESCLAVLKEMETKWNEVMAKGRLMQDKNDQLRDLMKSMDNNLYEENLEAKIGHYISVKNIVMPSKDEKDKAKHLKKA